MKFYLKNDIKVKIFQYNGLKIELHPEVYDPAEDTFLLINSLDIFEGNFVLEIGTGCGLVALECARIGANVVCTDVNPYSVDLAKRNYNRNKHLIKGKFEVRKGYLFSPIKPNELFDLIIFNPPYLPTKENDLVGGAGWFDIATDGGFDGLKITSEFIDKLSSYLTQNGSAYFVFSSLSDRKKLESLIKKRKFQFKVVSKHSFDSETISIYLLKKKKIKRG